MPLSYIESSKAPRAIGPYSQAVRAGNLLFVSGQIGLDPQTGALVGPDIELQTRQVLKNLQAILETAGLDFSNVAEATIFMTDMADFQKVNAIYAEFMAAGKPARATVGVANLPKGAGIEIKLTAVFHP